MDLTRADLTNDYSRLEIDLTLGQHYLSSIGQKPQRTTNARKKETPSFCSLGKRLLSLRPLSAFLGVHHMIRLYVFSRVNNWMSRRYVSFYTLLLLSTLSYS